jgi:hypothetical protein
VTSNNHLARVGIYSPTGVRILTLERLNSRRIRKFLIELLNLQQDDRSALRFVRLFSDFRLFNQRFLRSLTGIQYEVIGPKPEFLVGIDDLEVSGDLVDYIIDVGNVHPEKVTADELISVVVQLVREYIYQMFSATWIEPDPKIRVWGWAIFRTNLAGFWHPTRRGGGSGDSEYLNLRHEGTGTFISRLPFPPEPLPIEQAFEYLIKHHDKTRHCPYTGCPTPYFFATRHTQRYCSEKCAQGGQKQSKRKWWAQHGPEWRKRATREVKPISKRSGPKVKRKRR